MTNPETPADPVPGETARLVAAAAHLRRLLADLGDNRGPWYIANEAKYPYPQSIRNTGVPYVVADTYTDPPNEPSEARYICSMHPGVGEALAAWLELEADVIAARAAQPEGAEWAVDTGGDHALAVADAILAGVEL